MSFRIDSGLFKLDFTDRHAILGIPVDADIKDIRRRYLKIARRLHPDSCPAESQAEKEWANQLLSKLVNPAYEKLSQQRSLDEYTLLLSEVGKRLAQETLEEIELKGQLTGQLSQTSNIEHVYRTLIYQLAEKQYESLEQVLQMIAQISELNLVYLKRRAASVPSQLLKKAKDESAPSPKAGEPSPPPKSFVDQYFRRAQELMAESKFAKAGLELQEAIKLEPNNSRCHSLMGMLYLKQNLLTMAKIYFERSLTLNPKDEIGLAGTGQLEQLGQRSGGKKALPKSSDKSSGGVFGGIFGRKNK